ncbi:MAG TPA: glycosyltransferase family 2 protein [Bryobacteraceae bacterium]|nr:glycosyltransferase family 2 protein [Bryobacteraceae bacterium]
MSDTARRTISVIVPCRNEIEHIGTFVASVLGQERGDFDLEVVIADGMSTDGSREAIAACAEEHPGIRMLDNPGLIVSAGLNAALREARGDVIVRMDVHTEYAPDYIRQCVAVLDATGADNVGGCPRVPAKTFRMRVFGAAYHSPFAVGRSRCHDPEYEGYVDTVFYGCWRKSTLMRLGGLDEDLVRNQDDELNLRLTRAGGKIWQSRRIVCWYNPRTTLRSLFRQYCQYGFWKVLVIRKHRLPASWRHLAPGAFTLGNAVLVVAALVGAVAGRSAFAVAALELWAGLLMAYALLSGIAAVWAARRHGWLTLPFLPFLFLTYHVAYGVGFVAGLVHWAGRPHKRPAAAFVELTR